MIITVVSRRPQRRYFAGRARRVGEDRRNVRRQIHQLRQDRRRRGGQGVRRRRHPDAGLLREQDPQSLSRRSEERGASVGLAGRADHVRHDRGCH